jgi:hypothetical protein
MENCGGSENMNEISDIDYNFPCDAQGGFHYLIGYINALKYCDVPAEDKLKSIINMADRLEQHIYGDAYLT